MKRLLFVCLLIGPLLVAAQQHDKPNVVIIFIDDMGYGDLSCYGNKQVQTTNIDALAARGTRFTQFYVNSPVCSPSRVAMMTGQYPARHQFYTYLAERKKNQQNKMPDFLPANVPSLAGMLRKNGYRTAHFGKWHLGGGRDVGDAPLPAEYGFDKSFTSFEGLGDRTLHLDDNLNKQSAKLGRGIIVEAPQHQQTALYVDSALAFIKANRKQPFMINLFPNDVHDPYNPEVGSDKSFEGVTNNKEQQKFLAVLKHLDEQLGRFVGELKKLKLLENTIIVLTSDNGPTDWPNYYRNGGEPPCSAGDYRGRKWSLYEGGIRVPFIISWPGKIPIGKVNDKAFMSVIDILPSILGLTKTQASVGYQADGKDQSLMLFGSKDYISRDLFWYYNNEPLPGKQENISPTLAVRSGNWKLLMDPGGEKLQLYNLQKDHRETRNVAKEEGKLVFELKRKLDRWYKEVVKGNAMKERDADD